MDPTDVIGVIGLGNMGGAVAQQLLALGKQLVVYDLNPERMAHFANAGAVALSSPRQVAKQASTLLTILPNGPNVEDVAFGEDGVLTGAVPELLWLEMSTIDPEVTRRVARQAADQQVRLLDAAIGGRREQGSMLLMVGGDEADVHRAQPIFALLGRAIHCGPVGAGVTMKLVNNLLAGVSFVATYEALLLGCKAGLAVETMQEVLSGTAANTAHLHGSLPSRVLPRDFTAGFRLDLMYKDADLALMVARRLKATQTLGVLVQELRATAINRGLGDSDTTALVQILEEMSGARLSKGMADSAP